MLLPKCTRVKRVRSLRQKFSSGCKTDSEDSIDGEKKVSGFSWEWFCELLEAGMGIAL
jgi:hypothetical protein